MNASKCAPRTYASINSVGSDLILLVWEFLLNRLQQALLVSWLHLAARNPSANAIQQLQPVLKLRVGIVFPFFETPFALKKLPYPTFVSGIVLHSFAVVATAFPTDLSLSSHGYCGRFTAATAMAAMPSSRPRKPSISLVVALMPIWSGEM